MIGIIRRRFVSGFDIGVRQGSRRLTSKWTPQMMDESEFHSLADDVLHRIDESLEDDLLVAAPLETEHSDGVLSIHIAQRSWVLNKQAPNRQLWLSSPISGPNRFDYFRDQQRWLDTRSRKSLKDLLEVELSTELDTEIQFEQRF